MPSGTRSGLGASRGSKNASRTLTTPGADGATIRAKPFQAFVNQNRGSLRAVLSDQQLNSINAIADDLQRSTRMPGPSVVADARPSILRRVISEGAGMLAGGAISHAPLIGPAIGWLGVKAVNAMRDAGISKVDDLLREAMLHPEVAKALLAKVPARAPQNFGNALALALGRSAVLGAGPQLSPAFPPSSGQYPTTGDFPALPRLPVQNAAGAP